MRQPKKRTKSFRELLEKYLQIKGLDIVLVLETGEEIELYKNREIIDDILVSNDIHLGEMRIPIVDIKSVDMYAA